MQIINTRNVHQALPQVMYLMATRGKRQDSRNGPVLKVPGPVSICYNRPTERVMFWSERDANPFFHLLEALWMLAGRNDVAFLAGIVPKMASFSDDDVTLNSAYGHRWRNHFGYDQLFRIVEALRRDRYDRRQVLSMWDAKHDLGSGSKDLPCNTQVMFSRTDTGALDIAVTNRSNDVVWGALGANAVHFSMLQEYMAAMIGCEVGKYWQITNNLHLYLDSHERLLRDMVEIGKWSPSQASAHCPYEQGVVKPTPLIPGGDVAKFDADVAMLIDAGMSLGMTDWFCRKVANPMKCAIQTYKTHQAKKNDRIDIAQGLLGEVMDVNSDWRVAGHEWLERRAVDNG